MINIMLIIRYLVFITNFFSLILFIPRDIHCQPVKNNNTPVTIVIHGGAGTIRKADLTAEEEQAYRSKLEEAINSGYEILKQNGTAVEAVVQTVKILEDSPLFNAGKGSVFTHEGKNEMDASIMDGKTLNAGAVAGVSIVKNPIDAALAVMEKSPHVLLSGKGADEFARANGLDIVDPRYFYTERRYMQLQNILKEEENGSGKTGFVNEEEFGTVGVLALDKAGNLAAGTSTGGLTNKRYGRIGDSPLIGAGTYADNNTCAVSSTGHGEFFIRKVVAYDIAARVKYLGQSIQEAADRVIKEELPAMGGEGGVIVLDRQGNIAMSFNTEGMYRGFKQDNKKAVILIYRDNE